MSDDQTTLSADAIEALRNELEGLKTEARPRIAERLKHAISLGDLSENAEYDAAKHEQGMIEGRIQRLEMILKTAVVREAPTDAKVVVDGVKVTVRDTSDHSFENSYIVASSEERASGASVLSPESPLGKVLMGRRVGDEVTHEAPAGNFTYEIIEISIP